ncbi:MAG: hypothetical protein IPN90_00655 [Elusimicrobia bacterium]|nr:hypothetical protein [Elusimicrobiota bacterium]
MYLKRYHILLTPLGQKWITTETVSLTWGTSRTLKAMMMKVSSSLADSFQEGLEIKKPIVPPIDEALPPPEPEPVHPPTSYFIRPEKSETAPVTLPFSEEETERKARAAAEVVAEIVWPHRIPRRQA